MTHRIEAWAALVAVAAVAGPALADPPGKFDAATVSKAWEARERKVKSFAFEWTDVVTTPRGRISRNRPAGGAETRGEVPPVDLVFRSPRSILMDGDKARYRYSVQHWWPSRNGPVTEECDSSFDGSKYTSAAAYTPADVTPPTGTIKKADYHADLSTLSARPAMVALRGTHPKYRVYDPAAYEATGRTVKVHGVACAELVRENQAQAFRSVLLVDPARDCVLVRATRHERGKLSYQIDIAYSPDPVAGWVPASWEHAYHDATGALYASGRCKAVRCQINPALDDDAMTCVPPPGTQMVDVTGPQQLVYVVQADGAVGKRFPRGSDVTYEQMAAAGPEQTARWWLRGPWLASAAVFLASVGLLGWRGVSRARSRRGPPDEDCGGSPPPRITEEDK